MKFNKGLFDFIGYMRFFNPIGTGAAGDSKANQEVLFDDVQECSSAEEFAENTQMSLIAWKMRKSFGRTTENFAASRTSEHLKRFAEFCEICFVQNVYQLRII